MQIQKYYFKNIFKYHKIFRGVIIGVSGSLFLSFVIYFLFDKTTAGIVLMFAVFVLSKIIIHLTKKLSAIVTIRDDTLEISIPECISIFKNKRINENIRWKKIVSAVINDKKKGMITLKTKSKTYSFGYADRFQTNEKLVKQINEKIPK